MTGLAQGFSLEARQPSKPLPQRAGSGQIEGGEAGAGGDAPSGPVQEAARQALAMAERHRMHSAGEQPQLDGKACSTQIKCSHHMCRWYGSIPVTQVLPLHELDLSSMKPSPKSPHAPCFVVCCAQTRVKGHSGVSSCETAAMLTRLRFALQRGRLRLQLQKPGALRCQPKAAVSRCSEGCLSR